MGKAHFFWERGSRLCFTVFDDATVVKSWPSEDQIPTAADLGYPATDEGVALMNRHHEYLHSALAFWVDGVDVSTTLWAVAHGLNTDTDQVRHEEERVLEAQRRLIKAVQDTGTLHTLPSVLRQAYRDCHEDQR